MIGNSPLDPEIKIVDSTSLDVLVDLDVLSFSRPWSRESYESMIEHGGQGVLLLGKQEAVQTGESAKQRGTTKRQRSLVAVGFVFWQQFDDEAELLRLGVHPNQRRQGLATRLVTHMIHQLNEQSVTTTYLEVRRNNTGALGLYRGFGFLEVGVRRGYYENGEDALVLARKC